MKVNKMDVVDFLDTIFIPGSINGKRAKTYTEWILSLKTEELLVEFIRLKSIFVGMFLQSSLAPHITVHKPKPGEIDADGTVMPEGEE